ncbi:MAG: DUF642 domain-containing protein [Myxococcota bacterium]
MTHKSVSFGRNSRAFLLAFGVAACVSGCSDSDRTPSTVPDAGAIDASMATDMRADNALDAARVEDAANVPDAMDAASDLRAPSVNLLRNGSFETWTDANEPNVTPDDWDNCTIGTFGIAVDGAPDFCEDVESLAPAAAIDGERWARGWQSEGVAQTVLTTPGATYQLTFAYCGMLSCVGGGTSSEIAVLVDGEELARTPDLDDTEWRTAEFEFEATSAETTICLRNVGSQSGLDAVTLTER